MIAKIKIRLATDKETEVTAWVCDKVYVSGSIVISAKAKARTMIFDSSPLESKTVKAAFIDKKELTNRKLKTYLTDRLRRYRVIKVDKDKGTIHLEFVE